jgi:ribosome-associated translation inhibitor RaiA
MDIKFKGTKYEPTPEIIDQVNVKVGALDRFLGGAETSAKAVIELERAVGGKRQGDVWRAELTIDHDGKTVRAESTKAKLDHAITTVVRDVARELGRANKHDHDLFRKGGAAVKSFLRGFDSK